MNGQNSALFVSNDHEVESLSCVLRENNLSFQVSQCHQKLKKKKYGYFFRNRIMVYWFFHQKICLKILNLKLTEDWTIPNLISWSRQTFVCKTEITLVFKIPFISWARFLNSLAHVNIPKAYLQLTQVFIQIIIKIRVQDLLVPIPRMPQLTRHYHAEEILTFFLFSKRACLRGTTWGEGPSDRRFKGGLEWGEPRNGVAPPGGPAPGGPLPGGPLPGGPLPGGPLPGGPPPGGPPPGRFIGETCIGCPMSPRFPAVERRKHSHQRDAFDSAKNRNRQRRKHQSVTAKREKSQTPKFVTVKW